jgi:hypothetical protein
MAVWRYASDLAYSGIPLLVGGERVDSGRDILAQCTQQRIQRRGLKQTDPIDEVSIG